mmetsp:Transcript_106293/g.204469  ORF Transcript_106293/g.204469 Transcript_106293/m.204469 type:complete len:447 (+) Transcript_106293:40-1380(+)
MRHCKAFLACFPKPVKRLWPQFLCPRFCAGLGDPALVHVDVKSAVKCNDADNRKTSNVPIPDDIKVLVHALQRLGICESNEVDLSWRSSSEGEPCLISAWLDGVPRPLSDLPPLHSAIFASSSESSVAIRVRTRSTQYIASKEGAIRSLSQDGARFHGRVAVCDTFSGAADALKEVPLASALLVRGVGTWVLAQTVPHALILAFYLDTVCRVQMLVGPSRAVVEPEAAVWAKAKGQCSKGLMEWPAVKAWLKGETLSLRIAEGQREGVRGSFEWEVRHALWNAHQDVVRRGEDQLTWNHMSAKFDGGLLLTPGDWMWGSITPESFKLSSSNVTADVLHRAVYTALPSAQAVVHLHATAVQAVSCLQEGVQLDKGSPLADCVSYHDWEGISDDFDEQQRVVAAIEQVPSCKALILRNHGAITIGSSVEEALQLFWALDTACQKQLQL